MRIGIAQLNFSVGDLEENQRKIVECMQEGEAGEVDLLCFPELSLTGYPPEDLVLNLDFVERNLELLHGIASCSGEMVTILGFIDLDEDCFNAAAVLNRGQVRAIYHKSFLPNYGVFDENRYFSPGRENLVVVHRGTRIGITICEDIWYPGGPLEEEVTYGGAEIIVNLSASPFYRGKQLERERLVHTRAQDGQVIVVYINTVGGQDELVFDGRSFVYHPDAGVIFRGPGFKEALLIFEVEVGFSMARRNLRPLHRYMRQGVPLRSTKLVEIPGQSCPEKGTPCPVINFAKGGDGCIHEQHHLSEGGAASDPLWEVYSALILGLRDYFRKNGMQGAVVGLSGGVDSALVAALAVDALGKGNVHGLFMPSRYTSPLSHVCVRELAEDLGIELIVHPIDDLVGDYQKLVPFLGEGGVPWRICRPASGGTCSWPIPTVMDGWCWPLATRASSPWVTALCTGTWWGVSPSSRTSLKGRFTGLRAISIGCMRRRGSPG